MNDSLILELLGSPFLEYVLNASAAEVAGHFSGAALNTAQQQVFNALQIALDQISPNPDANEFLRAFELGNLVTYDPANSTSFANALRISVGGSIDTPIYEGVIEQRMAEMARDIYPVYLIPRPSQRAGLPAFSSSLFRYPTREALAEAIMNDSALKLLFPKNNETLGKSGSFITSVGRGGSIQLELFPETLLRSAWDRCEILNSAPSLTSFVEATVETVRLVRSALSEQTTTVPVRVGLTGVRLPDEKDIELPWGKLRPAVESDRIGIPDSSTGQLTHTNQDGESVVIDYGGDVVMEMEIPYRIREGELDVTEGWPADMQDHVIVQRRIESVQLGLLLTSTDNPRPFVVMSWQRTFDPLAYGSSLGWRDTHRTPNLVPTALDDDQCTAWGEWVGRVDTGRADSIEVAIRRVVLAATDRQEPSDALVDAVIAWENLVGSRRGEPTLRISAALAWLLASADPNERIRRKSDIGKLYELRSDVVHGNRNLEPNEAHERSRQAIRVAIEALQALFRDRPELLIDCKSGDERSNRLIINGS